jgi:hypothetical protein
MLLCSNLLFSGVGRSPLLITRVVHTTSTVPCNVLLIVTAIAQSLSQLEIDTKYVWWYRIVFQIPSCHIQLCGCTLSYWPLGDYMVMAIAWVFQCHYSSQVIAIIFKWLYLCHAQYHSRAKTGARLWVTFFIFAIICTYILDGTRAPNHAPSQIHKIHSPLESGMNESELHAQLVVIALGHSIERLLACLEGLDVRCHIFLQI